MSQCLNPDCLHRNPKSTNFCQKCGSVLDALQLTVKPTFLQTPEPIPQPDIELKSARGVNYYQLEQLLKTRKWKEADQQTANIMLEVAGRTQDGCLRVEDIDNFPCEDLHTIDQLWVRYSNGRFGFTVQKRIYQSLGGTQNYDSKILDSFGDQVGWRFAEEWLDWEDLKFNQTAPIGHLPQGGVLKVFDDHTEPFYEDGMWFGSDCVDYMWVWVYCVPSSLISLFSRVKNCKL